MPVFEPNEYFWNNHWDSSKEEKWEAYARAVQTLIAKQGGFYISDNVLEDKVEYKKLMKDVKKER